MSCTLGLVLGFLILSFVGWLTGNEEEMWGWVALWSVFAGAYYGYSFGYWKAKDDSKPLPQDPPQPCPVCFPEEFEGWLKEWRRRQGRWIRDDLEDVGDR